MDFDSLNLAAQEAVDELMNEHLLPFKLNVGKLTAEGASQYTVHFYDSRLYAVTVTWNEGQSFKDLVRAAVLDRASRMRSDPGKEKR